MSERRLLTRKFVNRVKPPENGERWIADASIAGFGLRLWQTGAGGNKAFSVRLRDLSGKQVRRTYPVEESYAYRAYLYRGRDFSLGHCLEDARSWARDQIDICHGRPTLADIERADRNFAADRIKNLTLARAGELLLKGLYARGYSQKYIDRLDKLFFGNTPSRILATPLIDIKAEEVARVLIDERLSFGNIRILRAFVCQIFEEARWFYGPLGGFTRNLSESFGPLFEQLRDVRFPALRAWFEGDFDRILSFLDSQADWQSANAIVLFLYWGAPLSRVRQTRWKEIFEDNWYPYGPGEKKTWFESRQRITPEIQARIERIRELVIRDFGDSDYLFPSSIDGPDRPIASVERMWRRALVALNYPAYPLREVGLRRREPTRPSYWLSFLRQYGPMLRRVQNAAEVSKIVTRRRSSSVISAAYDMEHRTT